MRVGELGTVYRYERGGTLHGMLRVRGFTQDDAHIFCRPDQVEEEIDGVLDLTFDLLSAFGFDKYTVNVSTRPDKAVGSDEQWKLAENSLKNTLHARGLKFDIEDLFSDLDLLRHLSSTRGNGLRSMVARIQSIAEKIVAGG